MRPHGWHGSPVLFGRVADARRGETKFYRFCTTTCIVAPLDAPIHNKMARIIVTDDEEPIRSMMATALNQCGHTVEEAKSAREALEKHRQHPADLIVTDLVMKEMDGTELLRRVRAFSPQTPIIGVSGHRHGKIYLNMLRLLGAANVLAKPFTGDELAAAVEKALVAPSKESSAA
ncbi:MAG TPA: response regulator [Opitutaceae bacterium]|nr:response regulator [Opitutaceae bacterium]